MYFLKCTHYSASFDTFGKLRRLFSAITTNLLVHTIVLLLSRKNPSGDSAPWPLVWTCAIRCLIIGLDIRGRTTSLTLPARPTQAIDRCAACGSSSPSHKKHTDPCARGGAASGRYRRAAASPCRGSRMGRRCHGLGAERIQLRLRVTVARTLVTSISQLLRRVTKAD